MWGVGVGGGGCGNLSPLNLATGSSLNVPDVLGDEVSAKELTGVNLVAEGPRLGDCLLVARLLSSPTVLPWLLLLVSVSESQAAPCTVVVTASSVTVALDSSGNSPKLLMTSDI